MDNNCVIECKEGCQTCYIDYDFCLDCEPGYVWNDDYTCLPSVIGLLATTLFLLVVGTVFIVISFMKVNAAAKWSNQEYLSLFLSWYMKFLMAFYFKSWRHWKHSTLWWKKMKNITFSWKTNFIWPAFICFFDKNVTDKIHNLFKK